MRRDRYLAAEQALAAHHGLSPRDIRITPSSIGSEVRLQEVGDGPPVLFVHGTTTAGASWMELAARLQDRFRCLLLDRPGCGLSEPMPSPPGPAGLPEHAAALVLGVLDELRLDRACLVTASMGGFYGMRAAAAAAERVECMAHLGWSLGTPIAGPLPWAMRLAARPLIGRLAARLPVNRSVVVATLRESGMEAALSSSRIPEELIDWTVALMNHTATRQNEFAFAHGTPLDQLIEELLLESEELATITAPTRILYGTDDPFGTTSTMETFAEALPHGELVVLDGVGHTPWIDQPNLAADLVGDFLVAVST